MNPDPYSSQAIQQVSENILKHIHPEVKKPIDSMKRTHRF